MNKKSEGQYMAEVKKVIGFFEENCYGNVKFSDVAGIVNIGETNFKRYFKKFTGCSVMKYFKKQKIAAAKRLIDKKALSFTEISSLLGYESVHYFSRQFKAIEGITPTEYKNKGGGFPKKG